jgi:hypothetical protein
VDVDADRFDAQVDLLSGDELRPGEDAQVGVSFLSPDLVHSRIRTGATYPVFEGAHEIGNLVVQADVWKDAERVVQVGREYSAVVTKVGWTVAEVTLENGWRAGLRSRDVGLPPWAEIGGSLHEGERLRVRVEAVDVVARSVALRLQPPRSAG